MPTSTLHRWSTRAGQWLLSGTAVIGSAAALLVVLALVLGVRPVVFRSGSMEPAVATGALGFSRMTDAQDLDVGDVVTVHARNGKTITHRIVAAGPSGGVVNLRLKGDDNPVPDDEIYAVTKAPELWFAIPGAGYVVAWFANAPGSYLLGAYVMLMLLLVFRRRTIDQDGLSGRGPEALASDFEPAPVSPVGDSGRHVRKGPVAAAATAAVVVLIVVVAGWSQATWAAWNDSVATNGTTIATGSWGGDTVAPTVTVSYPKPGDAINNGQWNNNNCQPGMCGTAADNPGGTGLAGTSALYELRRTSTTPNVCYSWNGSTLVVVTCGVYQSAPGPLPAWRIPVPLSGVVAGTYELRVKVSDLAGNTNRPGSTPSGTADTTFTK